jgi:hypothetical protein
MCIIFEYTLSYLLKSRNNKNLFMPKLAVVVLYFFMSITCYSQTIQFKKGQVDLSAGIGFLTPFFAIDGYDVRTKRPPISLTVDYGVSEEISIGLYIATAQDEAYGTLYNLNTGQTYYGKQSTISHFLVGGRVLYHFILSPKFDTYAGAMLGYNAISEKSEPGIELFGETSTAGFTYTILGGGRYRFTPHVGAFLELGYGVSVVTLGLNIKL